MRKTGAAERPPRKQTWHIPVGVSELGGDVVGCALRLVMYIITTFPGRARLPRPSWKHGVNEGEKTTTKLAPYFFVHARQSSKIQSIHRNGAHRLKACKLVVHSVAEHSALGAMVSVSGGPEHASPPEV